MLPPFRPVVAACGVEGQCAQNPRSADHAQRNAIEVKE